MMKRFLPFITIIAILSYLTNCGEIDKLLDEDLKLGEPYFATWEFDSIRSYSLYAPPAQPQVITNDVMHTDVAGEMEFTSTKDADESYFRGMYSLSYITDTQNSFRWDLSDGNQIYIELDDTSGEVLQSSEVHIDFVSILKITDSQLHLSLATGGLNDSYFITEYYLHKK